MLTLAQFLTLEPLISSRDRINPEENAIETSLALPSIAVTAFELSSRSFVGGTEETTSSSIVVFERLASKKGKKVIMERGKDGARPRKRRERKRDSRESPSSLPLFRVTRRKRVVTRRDTRAGEHGSAESAGGKFLVADEEEAGSSPLSASC